VMSQIPGNVDMVEFNIKEIMRQEVANQFTESLWMLYISMTNNRSRNLKF